MFTLAQAATAATQAATNSVDKSVWDWSKWDGTTWGAFIMGTLVALLVLIWGGVRFWLVVTRPPKIKDVHTPTLDHMNEEALSHMGPDGDGELEAPDAPDDLLAAVPGEEAASPEAAAEEEEKEKKDAPA